MKPIVTIIIILFCATASFGQKWALRGSFNVLRSDCGLQNVYIQGDKNLTSVTHNFMYRYRWLRGLYIKPEYSWFADISLARTFKNKHSLVIGYRNMHPIVYSTIRQTIYHTVEQVTYTLDWGTTRAEKINVPTLKFNYSYTLAQKNKVNASSITVFGGILMTFRGRGAPYGNGNWGDSVYYLDTAGNRGVKYLFVQTTLRRPMPPVPYLNVGVSGDLRLGKRFKLGLELAACIGYKTLYAESYSGVSRDATFTYKVYLKPYFFSGGIYLQYRIE